MGKFIIEVMAFTEDKGEHKHEFVVTATGRTNALIKARELAERTGVEILTISSINPA